MRTFLVEGGGGGSSVEGRLDGCEGVLADGGRGGGLINREQIYRGNIGVTLKDLCDEKEFI